MQSIQRQLFIMRHAKSSWAGSFSNDFNRPLNQQGATDAPRVGLWLKQSGFIPDSVVCSPAERARQTALAVCKSLVFKVDDISWQPQLYAAGLGDILRVLADIPDHHPTVLLIGHNPGLEYLLQYLAGSSLDVHVDGKLLPTATCAILNINKSWVDLKNDAAQLVSLVRPKVLG